MAGMSLKQLLVSVLFALGSSSAVDADGTCEKGGTCVKEDTKQTNQLAATAALPDTTVFIQSGTVLARMRGDLNITPTDLPKEDTALKESGQDADKVFVRPAIQKLAEMNATMDTLKALSEATPEVNAVVNGMVETIKTDIKPPIIGDQQKTQNRVTTTITTLSTRTAGAVEKKGSAVAADKALGQCYAEQRRLLVLHETCKDEEAVLVGEKASATYCGSPVLLPKTYSVLANLKEDLTCDFSLGTCTAVRDARKMEYDEWLDGLNIVGDKEDWVAANNLCNDKTDELEDKIASCNTMWSNIVNKHAQCLYALKAQELAICMFGDNLQSKCETKSSYDALIVEIEGTGNANSESDRAGEWRAVNKLQCMLQEFVGGATFDNAMISECTETDEDAEADFATYVIKIDKKDAEYVSLITEENFNCAETAITFTGDKWTVPPGDLTTHTSSGYTSATGYEYVFASDSSNPPFAFCLDQSTCGSNFACGAGVRKLPETKCYVVGGCTAVACCVKDAFCGDHVLDANEECDDGNDGAGDGCSAACTSEASCSRPSGWCTHGGATYSTETDCDGDGLADLKCIDSSQNVGYFASGSSCKDTWPNGGGQCKKGQLNDYIKLGATSCISAYTTEGNTYTLQMCADRCNELECAYFSRPANLEPSAPGACWTTVTGAPEGNCNENVYQKQAALIMGNLNSTSCPGGTVLVADAAECERSATVLGLEWQHVSTRTDGPGGCFANDIGRVWFNENVGGPAHPRRKLICKQEPPAVPAAVTGTVGPAGAIAKYSDVSAFHHTGNQELWIFAVHELGWTKMIGVTIAFGIETGPRAARFKSGYIALNASSISAAWDSGNTGGYVTTSSEHGYYLASITITEATR